MLFEWKWWDSIIKSVFTLNNNFQSKTNSPQVTKTENDIAFVETIVPTEKEN